MSSGVPDSTYFSTNRLNRDLPPSESGRWTAPRRETCYWEKGLHPNGTMPPFTYMLVFTGTGVFADHRETSAGESGRRYADDLSESHTLFSGNSGFYAANDVDGILRMSRKDYGQEVVTLFGRSRNQVVLSGWESLN